MRKVNLSASTYNVWVCRFNSFTCDLNSTDVLYAKLILSDVIKLKKIGQKPFVWIAEEFFKDD